MGRKHKKDNDKRGRTDRATDKRERFKGRNKLGGEKGNRSNRSKEQPKIIATFECAGILLNKPKGADTNWTGDCIFCQKENHFYVNPDSGQWDCKRCGEKGNVITFLGKIAEISFESTRNVDYDRLSKHRKIRKETLKLHTCLNPLTGEWLIPCVSANETVHNLRRYKFGWKGTRSTTGCKLQLWNEQALENKGNVWICEGEWDGIALIDLFDRAGETNQIVVAVPGAGIFRDEWVKKISNAAKGHTVHFLYDADKYGKHGQKQAISKFDGSTHIRYIEWPEDAPAGYDVRDLVADTKGKGAGGVVETLKDLFNKDIQTADHPKRRGDVTLRKIMKLLEQIAPGRKDLQQIMLISLGTCLVAKIKSDPVWMYVVGPPSTGKTLVLSAFRDVESCVFQSSISSKSLVSGWEQEEDPSLIPKLTDKCLIVKDFTEILSMNRGAQNEVIGTLRGAFDGYVHRHYGHGVERVYKDCRFSMLAGVTNVIDATNNEALGERFLRVYVGRVPEEAAIYALKRTGRSDMASQKLRRYVKEFLSEKMIDGIDDLPPYTNEQIKTINRFAQIASSLRVKVGRDKFSGEVLYKPEKEGPIRVGKQLALLGKAVAYAMGYREQVTDEAMAIVMKVAFDTATGLQTDILMAIAQEGGSATPKEISETCRLPSGTVYRKLEDLIVLGLVTKDTIRTSSGMKRTAKYVLAPWIKQYMETIV